MAQCKNNTTQYSNYTVVDSQGETIKGKMSPPGCPELQHVGNGYSVGLQ